MTSSTRTDANNTTECKGCSATVHVTAEEITKLFGETLRVKNIKLTTDMEYERRLTECRTCEAFQFGTTCRWCGCLMDIKAKLTAARCPDPSGSRWV